MNKHILLSLALLLGVSARGETWHGFAETRYGTRLNNDPVEDDDSLREVRLQLDRIWYGDLFTAQLKGDLVYDDLATDQDQVDLETGEGFFDLRMANVLFSPTMWMDVKVGRQVLTWGTGDLVFINDLFPKDWQSFFLGRDVEYLKAPSDALLVSLFPSVANIDIAYTPRFDADRHITGERLSYWNGQQIVGQDAIIETDKPDEWFKDDEIALRVYRNFSAYEVAGYFYDGFWKSPGGMDPASGKALFPDLRVYGASVRGPLGPGIANLETGYYDSRDDAEGDNAFINNSETRFLVGYEQEVVKNLTLAGQYYVEQVMDHDSYLASLDAIGMPTDTARDEARHTLTLRATLLAMNQNLILSMFTRWSPNEKDVYLKPEATYKINDNWQASIGGDLFYGTERYTFLGQFEDNNNVHVSLRYSI